jgi:hypothetical protein
VHDTQFVSALLIKKRSNKKWQHDCCHYQLILSLHHLYVPQFPWASTPSAKTSLRRLWPFVYETAFLPSACQIEFSREHDVFSDKLLCKLLIYLLPFTFFTAIYAQKSQNSGSAHACLGFITQKQRENTSRRQPVNSTFILTLLL